MQLGALLIIMLASVWLILVGWLMWGRPNDCLHWLSLMASTWKINVTELGLRSLSGAALVVRSPSSKMPEQLEIFGWFVLASSVVLILIPREWHAAYAVYWSKKLSAKFVRFVAPFAFASGISLAYFAI